jgi:hypothetical protein
MALLQRYAALCDCEISPVACVIGGFLGQEILKVVSGRNQPLNNSYVFDLVRSTAVVARVAPPALTPTAASSSSSSSSCSNTAAAAAATKAKAADTNNVISLSDSDDDDDGANASGPVSMDTAADDDDHEVIEL